MAQALDPRSPRRSRWTLVRRLSVLFVALLTLVVGAIGASAYVGVREAASLRSSERLESVARELAAGASRGVVSRINRMLALARDSTIRVALRAASGGQADSRFNEFDAMGTVAERNAALHAHREALDSLFARRRTAADNTLLGWHVLSETGTRLHGAPLATRDSLELAATAAAAVRSDSVVHSVLYSSESQIRLFAAVPVKDGDRIIGVIAVNRRITGSDSLEGAIKRLSGQNASVAFASRGSEEWSSVRGQLTTSPLGERGLDQLLDTGTVRFDDGEGETFYASSAAVTGAPWLIVLTEGEASIMARPRALLNELLMITVTVLLLGTIGAWWLSRLETRPLAELRKAADAMASGDYTRVVIPKGAEETAALAEAFNTMSMRISGVHATLAAQNEELMRANEAKARFLAIMSHELRTPLNAIGGYAELMALGVHGPTSEEQRHALERIARSKDQLLHLVSDILSYARLEATPLAVARESVPVMAQFESVRDTVADQFAGKGVQLVVTPTDATLCADPVRVQQILINLVTNALQFTLGGGRVDVYAEVEGDLTTLFVRDTGVGIEPEQQHTIFEPFVQVDNTLTRRSGGAGLGLAIVRQLATAMGGEVRMESTPGVGSTFAVSLPCAEAGPSEPTAESPSLMAASL